MNLFGRSWLLSLEIDKYIRQYSNTSLGEQSLHLEFRCEASAHQAPSNGELTIHGLEGQVISAMCTNYIPSTGALKFSMIKLEAGYRDAVNTVLVGNIIQAVPNFTSSVPSVKLTIMSGLSQNQQNEYQTITFNGITTLRAILTKLCSMNGWVLKYSNTVPNRTLEDYTYKGAPFSQIQKLRTYWDDVNIYLINSTLYCTNANEIPTTKTILNAATGLLGSPEPSPIGCNVRILMNTMLVPGDVVDIDSFRIPQLNGLYKLITVAHIGSSRGDAWYSNLTCKRM